LLYVEGKNMNIAIALVLGLLIGWLVEWVIDWFYWRRPREDKRELPASTPLVTQRIRYKTAPGHADDLKKIKGIGPVIAKRLNQAGIYTYEQLADLTLDEFEEALGDLLQRFINERAILRHARELADQKARGELK
jgi:predicted flap endonuclease-1-like 5' DNA nuclease